MKDKFNEKLVVITGGSSGIGKELAKRFYKSGANLAIIARDKSKLEAAKNELEPVYQKQKSMTFSCNVSDYHAVEATFREISDKLGEPDVLVNSAGILREGYFQRLSINTFQEVMGINYFGTLHCIKSVLPFFEKKKCGRIVNISSMGGIMAGFGYSAYCSSKFAVNGLTETLRQELKPLNIKIHLVCPPEFMSPMVEELNTYRTHENKLIVHTLPVMDIAPVADAIMDGIERERFLIIPGAITRIIERSNRLFPGLSRSIVDYRLRKSYKGPNS